MVGAKQNKRNMFGIILAIATHMKEVSFKYNIKLRKTIEKQYYAFEPMLGVHG
jgi:hypothetical protein